MEVTPRILVVKTSSLGDLFHALPAVTLLQRAWRAEVDWVVNAEYAALVQCFRPVNRAISFPRRNLLRGGLPFLRALRREPYEQVIDFQGLLKSGLIAKLADAGPVTGPSFQREGARWLYDATAGKRNKQRHAVEENLDVLRHFGLPDAPVEFPVDFPEQSPVAADCPLIVFSPCSRHAAKNWPIERFAELGRRLMAEYRCAIAVTGGPADRAACESVVRGIGSGAINLAGQTSLVELGGVLRQAAGVVTVDSGPMHMAAALGVPVVAVFGPTDPVRVGPYGSGHVVLRDPSLGSRAGNYSKKDRTSICRITVDQVLQAVRERLP